MLLGCDYYNAREWQWTLVIVFLVLLWILAIVAIAKQETVDLFNDDEGNNLPKFDNPPNPPAKSKFQQRLDAYMTNKND